MLGKALPPLPRDGKWASLEDVVTKPEPLAEKVWGKKETNSILAVIIFWSPSMHRQLGPQPPLPTLPLRRQEWLPRTHSGASPRLDGPRQSSEEASALGQAPRSPVHADSLRSTVLTWEDLVLKQCIPILSLRGAHTVTSSDAGQAAPGPCPTTQQLSLLLPYRGFLHSSFCVRHHCSPHALMPLPSSGLASVTGEPSGISSSFSTELTIWQLSGILYSWVTLLSSVHWWLSVQTGNSQIKRCHRQPRPQFSFNCCDLESKQTDIALKKSQQVSLLICNQGLKGEKTCEKEKDKANRNQECQ